MNIFGKILIGVLGVEYLKSRIASGIKEGLESVHQATPPAPQPVIDEKPKKQVATKPLTPEQKKNLTINLIILFLLIVFAIFAFSRGSY